MTISNFNESTKITETTINVVKDIFNTHLNAETHQLYSWGSVGRREMGPRSDLDLIIISKNPDLQAITRFKQSVNKALPNHRLDLLETYSPDELVRIGKIDGTDRQAILFFRNELKKNSGIDFDKEIKKDIYQNLREMFHSLSNIEFIYPVLFKKGNLKFSPGYLKNFHFIYLVANFLNNYKGIKDTNDALNYFQKKGFFSKKRMKKANADFATLCYCRNQIQEITSSENACVDSFVLTRLAINLNMTTSKVRKYLKNIRLRTLSLFQDCKKILLKQSRTILPKSEYILIKKLLAQKKITSLKLINKIVSSGSEISMILLAYVAKESDILEKLRKIAPDNWYILYAIANNRNSSEQTLIRLMVPEKTQKYLLADLYTDFAWRNIYLYIAKNPSSTYKIRKCIMNYPKAREMDIKAAMR